MDTKLKTQVMSFFKIAGFHVRTETTLILIEKIKALNDNDKMKYIDKILNHIQNQALQSSNIENNHMEAAIRDCFQTGFEDSETVFSVINAFDVPSFTYIKESKKFIRCTKPKKLLASADSRSEYIRNRYSVLLQRVLRHELFSQNTNENIRTSESNTKKYNIKYVENLLSSSKINDVVILGLLSKFKEGKFYLEDPTGAVPVDLQEAKFHSGLFVEGSFVLAEGKYNDGILKVTGLGFPPPEPSQSSQAYFGTMNTWGGNSNTLLKFSKRLLEYEKLNFTGTIIFLSDCWLDDVGVLENLKKLFLGYDESPPIAIVLMGPFLKSHENLFELKNKFSALGDAIDATFTLKNETDIILVPDMSDPSSANILPRPPIPESLVKDLKRKCKRIILATNPCRLQYCTQQIVVCRLDLVRKLCRNTIKFPQTGKLEDHFARTLICQGSLTPFTQVVMPTYWDFDASLSLYPLPDLIVVGDSSNEFITSHLGCSVINTGSFPRSKYSFKLYLPCHKTVEDSQIPGDDDED